jgi:hypothetical protein
MTGALPAIMQNSLGEVVMWIVRQNNVLYYHNKILRVYCPHYK